MTPPLRSIHPRNFVILFASKLAINFVVGQGTQRKAKIRVGVANVGFFFEADPLTQLPSVNESSGNEKDFILF